MIDQIHTKSPEELADAIEAAMRNRPAMHVVVRTRTERVIGVYEGVVHGSVKLEIDELSQAVRLIPCAEIEHFEIHERPMDRSDELAR